MDATMPAASPVVLDGGLSTALARAGHDLDDPLWTARLVADEPEAIVEAHLSYLRAGATVLITASYQASRRGFLAAGHDSAHADELLARTTALARRAIARFAAECPSAAADVRVAASIGPYGAVLADGSEYRGDYVRGEPGARADALYPADVVAFHTERLRVLLATRPDLLAIETIPGAAEAALIGTAIRAAVAGAGDDGSRGAPAEASAGASAGAPSAWCAFSCADDRHTCAGDDLADAVRVAQRSIPNLVAVGVNCTAPEHVDALLARARGATDLALVVYPNAGGTWNASTNAWTGHRHDPFDPASVDVAVHAWRAAGAGFVGGCCGTGPAEIARLAAAVGRAGGAPPSR